MNLREREAKRHRYVPPHEHKNVGETKDYLKHYLIKDMLAQILKKVEGLTSAQGDEGRLLNIESISHITFNHY